VIGKEGKGRKWKGKEKRGGEGREGKGKKKKGHEPQYLMKIDAKILNRILSKLNPRAHQKEYSP
jgi:hypothetical protein